MKTIVIGLGNPILGDDAIGWRIAEHLQSSSNLDPEVMIECSSLGGLSLMEQLIGYDRAILIDAFFSGKQPIGSISHCRLEEIPDQRAGHLSSPHDTTLVNAIKVGQSVGAKLPEDISIVAIEIKPVLDISDKLSQEVQLSIPQAVQQTLELLR